MHCPASGLILRCMALDPLCMPAAKAGVLFNLKFEISFYMQALRSLETGLDGWSLPKNWKRMTRQQVEYGLRVPNPDRMLIVKQVTCAPLQLPNTQKEQPVPERFTINIHEGHSFNKATCSSYCISNTLY